MVSLLGFAAGAAALVLGVVQGFPVAEGVRMRRRIRRCRRLVDAAIERGERCIGSTKIPICGYLASHIQKDYQLIALQ